MTKKQKLLVIGTILIILILVGVRMFYSEDNEEKTEGKINVITTFYPLEFLVKTLGGQYVTVASLVPPNTEIHSFQPSISDIVKLYNADIIVYNGAGADYWFEKDVIPSLNVDKALIIKTTENVSLLLSNEGNADSVSEKGKYDPHTWVSPFAMQQEAMRIYESLILKDPSHASYYEARWNSTRKAFMDLDTDYKKLAYAQKHDIFVTHAAYGYLADRYGFNQHSIIGLSSNEQPSAATIVTLVKQMEDFEIYVIFVDPIYSDIYAHTLGKTLEEKTGNIVTILKLYLMIGYVDDLDYFEQMISNLNSLKIGLGLV